MSSKRAYAGNARFIEIGSPGVPFRFAVNVDQLEGMRFEEKREVIEVPVPGTGIGDIPLEMREQLQSAGWAVVLMIGGRMNNIDFPTIEPAMACYNAIMSMIQTVGVPMVSGTKLVPPKPEPTILDSDGQAMGAVKTAVDAAGIEAGEDLMNPDLGDDPMLSDEELEALTKPENDG